MISQSCDSSNKPALTMRFLGLIVFVAFLAHQSGLCQANENSIPDLETDTQIPFDPATEDGDGNISCEEGLTLVDGKCVKAESNLLEVKRH